MQAQARRLRALPRRCIDGRTDMRFGQAASSVLLGCRIQRSLACTFMSHPRPRSLGELSNSLRPLSLILLVLAPSSADITPLPAPHLGSRH